MSERPPRTPYVLLGLLTLLTGAGPIAIYRVIGGGHSPRWPPDRPVEWLTFGLVVVTYVLLMAACLGIGLRNWRRTVTQSRNRQPAPVAADGRGPEPVDRAFNSD